VAGRLDDEAMTSAVTVVIADPVTPDLLHRFRNFGEDVWRDLRFSCDVSLDDVDTATTELTIRRIRKRELRNVINYLERQFRVHGFEKIVSIRVVREA
jgi:hypothetical protein